MPPATLRPIQGNALHPHAMGNTALACFGRIPTIVRQGAQWQQATTSDYVDDNGNSGGSDADNKDGDDGNNDDGEVDSDGGDNNDIDDDGNCENVWLRARHWAMRMQSKRSTDGLVIRSLDD